VTGSLHASLAQWLAGSRQPASYVASQGTVLGRADWSNQTWRTTGCRWARLPHTIARESVTL
jgi:predicted PhzF superfamily epimerase YddE/YHI9